MTWAEKITPQEAEIDFTQPYEVIDQQMRAFSPFPGSWVSLGGDDQPMRLKVKEIAPAEGKGLPGQVMGKGANGGPVVAAKMAALNWSRFSPRANL